MTSVLKNFYQEKISTLVKEKRYLHKNGSIVWVNLTSSIVKNQNNQCPYFVTVIEDITQRKEIELALQESEASFFNTLNAFPFPIWISRIDGIHNFFNSAWLNFTGKTFEQELDYAWSKMIHPDDLQYCTKIYKSALKKRQNFQMEYRLRRFDGKYCWILDEGKPRFKTDGSFIGFVGACIDISDRVTAEMERQKLLNRIKQERQFLTSVMQQMPVGVIIAQAPSGQLIFSNDKVTTILRHPLKPITKIADYEQYGCLQADGKPRAAQDYSIVKALSKGEIITGEETNYRCGDGIIRTLSINAAPICDRKAKIIAGIATFYDISEVKQAQKIQKDAENKAILLKEIHHRIKNNLQIVSTLLDLQWEQTTSLNKTQLLEDSQARIQTIALIHEQLYASANLDKINFLDYIQSLTNYLHSSFIEDNKHIKIIVDVESMYLDIDLAIPSGLIINELVINSLQHGFVSKSRGEIAISCYQISQNRIALSVGDNGIGIPKNISIDNSHSLGLSLVKSLVKDQLEGIIEIQRNNGTLFKIEFPII